jgi:hypothetical protein
VLGEKKSNERITMTAYQLAKKLLEGPDLPVVINGWGQCEGSNCEVGSTELDKLSFESGDSDTANDIELPCIRLIHY